MEHWARAELFLHGDKHERGGQGDEFCVSTCLGSWVPTGLVTTIVSVLGGVLRMGLTFKWACSIVEGSPQASDKRERLTLVSGREVQFHYGVFSLINNKNPNQFI